jgi:hypothetical protein
MQGGRSSTGRTSVPMSGRQATRLSSTPTGTGQPYKPNQWGAADIPSNNTVPAPSAARHQPATPNVRRAGSRVVTAVDSAALVQAGQQTGTPAEPVQQRLPAAPE